MRACWRSVYSTRDWASWPSWPQRLPDPRAQKFVTHTREALLTQQVYQILADYPDGNDANRVRHDPLFQTLADVSPDADQALASGSTLDRFIMPTRVGKPTSPWRNGRCWARSTRP